ncbi:FAD:protein FMN transferase [Microvirga sp. 17 mud 1-3]|uniref:FAD:protein FMN transferase n=1 Tax=Microvirga sp. 17 mud 1-3 TaxID=2082949 RepID=UPI000D6BCE97|nr:FAD:protein FMN transferase [Microvirga sp. 17 mud 1-3]AWM85410.1 thiamine biosynthesis protein ApbE [Microvirga sp. 17 mud 1-3]
MSPLLSRRRVIGISAAAAGLSLLPFGRAARAEARLVTWQGHAMGAVATLQIHHHDRATAERLVERSLAELRRMEEIFSLYRDDSTLSVLNRQGMLVAPPAELVALLEECGRYGALTGGAFDPTVQALWTLYRDHFTAPGADPRGPSEASVGSALERVGFGHIAFDRNRIAFAHRGMGLTLNGIAQGYVTDRVVDILREGGITSSLVDMGESRAIGAHPDGSPWRVGIADPDHPERVDAVLEAVDRAVATSGAYGFRFDPDGRFNHLLDPRTGSSARLYRSVTVVMPTATAADALSTAFSLLPEEAIAETLRRIGTGEVRLTTDSGEKRTILAA